MHSNGKQATKAEKRRMQRLPHIGCLACKQRGTNEPAQVHHLLSGGKRRGHRYTVPLCPWHHEGEPPGHVSIEDATLILGPSLKHASKRFHKMFGTDDFLLDLADKLYEQTEKLVVR